MRVMRTRRGSFSTALPGSDWTNASIQITAVPEARLCLSVDLPDTCGMVSSRLLLHSPLVGPSTWTGVVRILTDQSHALRVRRRRSANSGQEPVRVFAPGNASATPKRRHGHGS